MVYFYILKYHGNFLLYFIISNWYLFRKEWLYNLHLWFLPININAQQIPSLTARNKMLLIILCYLVNDIVDKLICLLVMSYYSLLMHFVGIKISRWIEPLCRLYKRPWRVYSCHVTRAPLLHQVWLNKIKVSLILRRWIMNWHFMMPP